MKKLLRFLVVVIMLFASCEPEENIKIPEVLPTNWKILVNPLGTNDTIPVPAEPYDRVHGGHRYGDTATIVSYRSDSLSDTGWHFVINHSQQLPPGYTLVHHAIIVGYSK